MRGVVAIAPHTFREEQTRTAIDEQIADFERGDLKARLARYHGAKTEQLFARLVEVWTADGSASWGLEPYLERIQCPVLAIQGAEDEFFSSAQIDRLSGLCPDPVAAIRLPRCGHAPHHQAPKPLIAAVVDFVRGLARAEESAATEDCDEGRLQAPS